MRDNNARQLVIFTLLGVFHEKIKYGIKMQLKRKSSSYNDRWFLNLV